MKRIIDKGAICTVCGWSDATLYEMPPGIVCGDCIDRAVDARKEAECEPA